MIRQHSVQPVQQGMILSTGRPQFQAQLSHHSRAEYSSSTFTSPRTIPSSLLSSHSPRESTILILTVMVLSVQTFSDHSGHPLLLSQRYFYQSVPCCVILIQTTHWCQKQPDCTKLTFPSTMTAPKSGLGSMPCRLVEVMREHLRSTPSTNITQQLLIAGQPATALVLHEHKCQPATAGRRNG